MPPEFITLLLLIIIANSTPVFIRFYFGNHLATAIDLGVSLFDGHRLFGSSKTWRGLIGSIVVTSIAAVLFDYSIIIGAEVAVLALLGDLFSSFIKRRFALKPGSMAPMLDQIPESLFPAFILMNEFALSIGQVLLVVLSFIIAELVLSRIFFMLGVRRSPY